MTFNKKVSPEMSVPRDVIDEAFESAEEWDEKDLIRTLAEKKLRSMDTSDPASYTKVASYLARKGFQGSDIMAVLEDLRSFECDDVYPE